MKSNLSSLPLSDHEKTKTKPTYICYHCGEDSCNGPILALPKHKSKHSMVTIDTIYLCFNCFKESQKVIDRELLLAGTIPAKDRPNSDEPTPLMINLAKIEANKGKPLEIILKEEKQANQVKLKPPTK